MAVWENPGRSAVSDSAGVRHYSDLAIITMPIQQVALIMPKSTKLLLSDWVIRYLH